MKLHPRLVAEAKPYRWFFIISISLGVMGGILGILQAQQLSHLISQVFLARQRFTSVTSIFIILLVIILLRAGTLWAGEFIASAGALKIKQALRQKLYSHISEIGPTLLRREPSEGATQTGELINTAIPGIEALDAYYSQYIPQVALAALVPLSILIFVIQTDLLSGVVLLVTAPLLPVFMYLIGHAAETLTRKQWKGLSRMSAYFLDLLQGLTTLKSLGRSREQVEAVGKVSEQYRLSTMQVLRVTFLSAFVLEFVATLSTAVIAVEIGIRLLYAKMAFEQAFFILLLAPEFYLPLRLLGTRFHAGMGGVEVAKSVYAVLDTPADHANFERECPPIAETASINAQGKTPPTIEYKHVGFSYSQDQVALQDVSFEVPGGKMTALAGESGAGKTTLAWLLLRFINPATGEIMINGKPLVDIPVEQWRAQLAWVSQNPYLFNDTVRQNIKIARPGATDQEISQAVKLAHADGFINQLTNGYDTLIGERGTRLSAGQAQRIALARAFLRDAPLLILDEATSHLDPDLDSEIQDSLLQLVQGRTVLVIAHRHSTLSIADQVVYLQHGKVEEIRHQDGGHRKNKVAQPITQATIRTSMKPDHLYSLSTPDHLKPSHSPVEKRLTKLLIPYAPRILLSLLLGFATIASSVGLMSTAAYIISAAALHPSIADLQLAIVGVRFFGLSRGVFRYFERLVSHDVTFRLLARWRTQFYQALEPLAPARLLQYHSGDLLSRVISDISTLETFYIRSISPPFIVALVAVASGLFMGAFQAQLAWVLIGFFALAGIGVPLLSFCLARRVGPQVVLKQAELSSAWVDGIQGLSDLLTNSGPRPYSIQLSRLGEQLAQVQMQAAGISSLQNALESLLASMAMLAVLMLVTISVGDGKLDGVYIGVLALVALTSFESMQPLPVAAQNYAVNREAASRLYELVDKKAEVIDPETPLEIPENFSLEVKNLSFAYPEWGGVSPAGEQSLLSLEDISFLLPYGKHIAIIGQSGAGKTTLIHLLMRYWNYKSGSILLDGMELNRFNQDNLRRHIAVMSQNTYLFSATIKQNLRIAHPDASDADIIQAARAAQLDETIQFLPEGYDTWVGEHGQRLSAGERQRLAVARMMLMDAPLVILDEPTANLDANTEREVLSGIIQATQGRSLILITQNMVGLDKMDEILVMMGGRIVEHGTHQALLAKKGHYKRMYALYNQMI